MTTITPGSSFASANRRCSAPTRRCRRAALQVGQEDDPGRAGHRSVQARIGEQHVGGAAAGRHAPDRGLLIVGHVRAAVGAPRGMVGFGRVVLDALRAFGAGRGRRAAGQVWKVAFTDCWPVRGSRVTTRGGSGPTAGWWTLSTALAGSCERARLSNLAARRAGPCAAVLEN